MPLPGIELLFAVMNNKPIHGDGFLFSWFVLHIKRLGSWGGVTLNPLGTSATNWPVVPALDDRR
jgi:hypothetical protein